MQTNQHRNTAACICRGYDPADPCMHGDTSQGCPKHDPLYVADDIDYFDDSHGPECSECGHYHDGPEGCCDLATEGCDCTERWMGDKKGWA